MGTPKPLLDWHGQTLIEYQVQQLQRIPVDQIIVVLGHLADEVRPLAHGALCVTNELYREGRAPSVRVGAAALSEGTDSVLILNVDQPRPTRTMQRLLSEHTASRSLITVPTHDGQRGHPAIFDGSLIPAMRKVREETQGLREIVNRNENRLTEVPFDSPIVLLDLNEPDQYEEALRRYPDEVTS
jgi:molybdenum cofactor cytidylyltransferase